MIVFNNMIADLLSKNLNPIVTELFIRGRKLNNFFITQSYFAVPENVRPKYYTLFHYKNSN